MEDSIEIIEPEAYPEEWLARIKPELMPGERLLWAGQASPRRDWSGRKFATVYALGFAVISTFGLAGLYGFLGSKLRSIETALALIAVFGAIISFLIVIGIVANVLSKGVENRQLARNLYALTDQRAILWNVTGVAISVESLPKRKIKGTHRIEYADSSGTVFFEDGSANSTAFVNVPEARRVEDLIRRFLTPTDSELQPSERA